MYYNLSKRIIKEMAHADNIWNDGTELYRNDKIYLTSGINTSEVIGVVMDQKSYDIELKFTELGDLQQSRCTCMESIESVHICKHRIAGLLELMDQGRILKRSDSLDLPWPFNDTSIFPQNQKEKIEKRIANRELNRPPAQISKLLRGFKTTKSKIEKEILNLDIWLKIKELDMEQSKYPGALEFSIGIDKPYKIRDISKFLNAMEITEELKLTKQFTYQPEIQEFSEKDKEFLKWIKSLYNDHILYGYNNLMKESLCLTSLQLETCLEWVEKNELNIKVKKDKKSIIRKKELPKMTFDINEDEDTIAIKLQEENYIIIDQPVKYIYDRLGNFFEVTEDQREIIELLRKTISGNNIIKWPKSMFQIFIDEMLPRLENIGTVKLSEEIKNKILEIDVVKEIYVDYRDGYITVKPAFLYDSIRIYPLEQRIKQSNNQQGVYRQREEEQSLLDRIEGENCIQRNGTYRFIRDESIFKWITETMPELGKEKVVIYTSKNYRAKKVIKSPKINQNIRLSSQQDYLMYDIEIEGLSEMELRALLKSYSEKKTYYRLRNGEFLNFDKVELEQTLKLSEAFQVEESEIGTTLKIPIAAASYVDHILKNNDEIVLKKDPYFESLVQKLENKVEEIELPTDLNAQLRPYQRLGFEWLTTLADLQLGGILADDMGLGKTIQVLTYLLHKKEKSNQAPSLIIAPTSLIYNWGHEIEKFAPTLTYKIIEGSKLDRDQMIEDSEVDVLITSYALIRRDQEIYQEQSYNTIILDEAQHIKNAGSIGAKAVKTLKSKHKFALTGTPIENHLGEFWSIFDFVLPDLLGTQHYFKNYFEKPIVQDGDEERTEHFSNLIAPFVLRRLKKEVLNELPDKIESIQRVKMTEEQSKLYAAVVSSIREDLQNADFKRERMKFLAGLTRLRQICSHPSSYIDNYEGGSGKIDALLEILEELQSGGHRTLIFSQFTSVLQLIRDEIGDDCYYLDGKTPAKERARLVKEFNEGTEKVFLISLKAGGTGLNLTGADTVIHVDPWWNPAVEDQASDRAYRIGQLKDVHVIKLITAHTVEEKIIKLQERKKALIDRVIKPGETFVHQMTEEEIRDLFE